MKKDVYRQLLAEQRERIDAMKRRCAMVDHPRPKWIDKRAEAGYRWWTRESCPCGYTGSSGTSAYPGNVEWADVTGRLSVLA